MNLYYSKLCVFVLLVVCRLVCGLSPLFISRKIKKKFFIDGIGKRWMEKGVSYSMDFSGGILLATSFIHMLPEVRDNLQSIMGNAYTFPFAETLVCIGLFTVYVIEEIVRHIVEDKSWHHRHHHNEKTDVLIAVKDADPQFVDVKLNNGREAVDGGDGTNRIQLVPTNNKTTLVSEMNIMVKEEVNECNNNTKNKNSVSLKHILLVSALSFHSVMEGIALGLAESLQDLWYLFLAVMAHECTILLCVGIDMVATCSCTSEIIKYMAVLAVVSPAVGGVVGTVISFLAVENGSASGWMTAVYIMQGLAAGTILYVTFFEVLNNHKHHHHQVGHRTSHNHQHSESGLPKLAFIAMGFAFMILLEMTSGHENHGHGHTPHHNETFSTNNSNHTHLKS